jgi:hypothetical protein
LQHWQALGFRNVEAPPHHGKRFVGMTSLQLHETQHVQACAEAASIRRLLRSADTFQNSLDSIIEMAHLRLQPSKRERRMLYKIW